MPETVQALMKRVKLRGNTSADVLRGLCQELVGQVVADRELRCALRAPAKEARPRRQVYWMRMLLRGL